ncbi:hypothetical protein, partial [Nostoc sp.]|uniref:hypothetical protein n=1 Tax=Nostoc sp. TaxID=1180 RepID=UPI002FFB115D
SEVKRCCGNDSLGVALRKNSSMPGIFLLTKSPKLTSMLAAFFWIIILPKKVYSRGKYKH